MVLLLLDTDVMVDILRGYEPAIAWVKTLSEDQPLLPGVVAMELIQGCANKGEVNHLMDFIDCFELVWPDFENPNQLVKSFASYFLSHRLSIPDAIIAACALDINATLCTSNVKHFKAFPHLKTISPYSKTIVT